MQGRRWIQTDLAPGDLRASRLDVRGLCMRAVYSIADPSFPPAYKFLAQKFGDSGALESVNVLVERFAWPHGPQADGWTLGYELIEISEFSDGKLNIAAVRDHTAAVPPPSAEGDETPQVIVHLSHVLVAERWRRSGLGGWLRALPLQVARDCLRASGRSADAAAVILIAEMEAARPGANNRPASLLAYEKAGFRKLDPVRVPYFQPDFRAPAEIDRSGGPRPLPFSLVIRLVGREHETDVSGATVRALARTLYRIYRDGCREADLAPLLAVVEREYPQPQERVRLVPPSSA